MRTIKLIGGALVLMLTIWSCVKTEPLDLEKDYTKASAERSKSIAEQEAKAKAEAEAEQEKKWEAYYKMLTDYKQKSWKGEKPFSYMFWAGWVAVEGIDKSWLQSIPDSTTAIAIWGGYAKEPEELTENQKFDLDIFHKKGSKVVTCYQVSNVGQGLPGGLELFIKKYGREITAEKETERVQIYARDLARHIIALNFDGFDIDWEPTIGNHSRAGYAEFVSTNPLYMPVNGYHANMITFIKELGKYFGARYEGDERKTHLRNLFDENFAEYHEKEKEYIKKYKPYFEKHNAVDKKFYLLFDGQFFQMTKEMDKYFDKYVMQDYGRVDTFSNYLSSWTANDKGSRTPEYYPPATRASSTAEFEKGQFTLIIDKAKAYKTKNGGVSSYKGELDFATTARDIGFSNYMNNNHIKFRNYKNYAWMREAMRVMDPRTDQEYGQYKEELIIRTPKK
ncbi:endoglycosidase [Capnocytophaga catalasegens]|uniref:Endoglycosidase n=1 Tax=Capnocytophaga catalasegens TaxID=1004260 RepID=A0AAV5AUU5_9FLAO|nr:endoglycosidase [Capnocytophaga catalasegens]GIZ16354.1 hypothetical protein RCZ03_23540 [Capnocytophaga catalasegens]GJM49120.1 hypothetical protein RCZ15_00960 [Capnocytophaga catalasegens]GJM53696.1 hypothetical protein RCZ16_20120 [Capnocytophaga catalasegens]